MKVIIAKIVKSFCKVCCKVLSFLGFDNVAEFLIQNDIDVNFAGQNDTTALILATEKGIFIFHKQINS